jgi:hypothetical protein
MTLFNQWRGRAMASELEEYLDKFDGVDRWAERVFGLSGKIAEMAEALQGNARAALAAIPPDWPTDQHMRELLIAYDAARGELEIEWQKLPARIRQTVPHKHPSKAGRGRMKIDN